MNNRYKIPYKLILYFGSDYTLHEEIFTPWLEENIGKRHEDWLMESTVGYTFITIHFKEETSAMAFKLVFNEHLFSG